MTTETILTNLLDDFAAACAKAKASLSPTITDRVPRPKPPLPTLGPAGFTFPDPTFGSRILRVTDEHTGGGSTSWRTPSGADRAFSADGSMFFLENSGGGSRVFHFDPQNFAATDLALDIPLVFPIWHQTNRLLIYGRDPGERPAVSSMSVLTGARTIVFDVIAHIAPIASRPRTYLRGIAHAGGALSFICGGESQDRDDFAVYLPEHGEPLILHTPTRIGILCHASFMDLSGRYVVLGSTAGDIAAGKAAAYVWDTTADTITPMHASAGGHGAIGFGVAVNCPDDLDSQEYRLRTLSDPNTARLVIADLPTPPQFFAANHLSWNHVRPDNQQPFVVVNYRYGAGVPVSDAQPWRCWDDEIIRVSVDGQTVERLAHHRSDVRHDLYPLTHVGYWAVPNVRTSPDGNWALFQTNWEKSLGPDPLGAGDGSAFRQDVIAVDLRGPQ